MGNQDLQTTFWGHEDFSYDIILELLQAQDRVACIFITVYSTFHSQCYSFIVRFLFCFISVINVVIFYQSVRLDTGHALALFAYNNPKQQEALKKTGRVPVLAFETFLGSDDETERAKAAFQVARAP